jgi:hypothetical protein
MVTMMMWMLLKKTEDDPAAGPKKTEDGPIVGPEQMKIVDGWTLKLHFFPCFCFLLDDLFNYVKNLCYLVGQNAFVKLLPSSLLPTLCTNVMHFSTRVLLFSFIWILGNLLELRMFCVGTLEVLMQKVNGVHT